MNKKNVTIVLLIILFIAVVFAAYKYYIFSKEYATTDAMFIRSDKITNLSFKRIRGKIEKLYFDVGDYVKKGDVVAEIDPVDYRVKLGQVKKSIEAMERQKKQLAIKKLRINSELKIKEQTARKKIEMLHEKLKSIEFAIAETANNIKQLQRDYNRYKVLYGKNVIAKRDYEIIETKLNTLKDKKQSILHNKNALLKQIDMAKENLKLIKEEFKQVDEMEQGILSLSEQIGALKEKYKDILHSVSYCKLYAPFNGKIGKKYAEEGMNVKSGYPVYSLIDPNKLYVEVLLEETKLKGINVGCKASFKVDSYPDREFQGVVEKIYPASAATYALVPRDISAGEFTKVAQRIVVKIRITEGDKKILIAGMGGEVKIKRKE